MILYHHPPRYTRSFLLPGVNTVFHELLGQAGRAFNHLAGSNHINHVLVKNLYLSHSHLIVLVFRRNSSGELVVHGSGIEAEQASKLKCTVQNSSQKFKIGRGEFGRFGEYFSNAVV